MRLLRRCVFFAMLRVASRVRTASCVYAHTYTHRRVRLVRPLYLTADRHGKRVAIVDQYSRHTYGEVLRRAVALADRLTDVGAGSHVALMCDSDVSYVIATWAVWMRGGVAVPLLPSSPTSRLSDCVRDSHSRLVVATHTHADRACDVVRDTDIALVTLQSTDYLGDGQNSSGDGTDTQDAVLTAETAQRHASRWNRLTQLEEGNKFKHVPALIVYTSGTSGPPKGVVHTYGSLQAQMESISSSWAMTGRDVLLHVLPLHHINGIVNALMTPLYTGATCVMLPRFDAAKVWQMLLGAEDCLSPRPVNLFMAVPTIYTKLINYQREMAAKHSNQHARDYIRAVCSAKIRLMVCGSASLPEPVLREWEELTGHRLLERYGLSEAGMVLGNPLRGKRTPGFVGRPFSGVDVVIARPNVYSAVGYDVIARGNSRGTRVSEGCDGESGELYVRGPSLFSEYWAREAVTRDAFTTDLWFKTGDTVCYDERSGYRVLGRTSVDIIKSGGYKISALDIERHLLAHPSIAEVAVVGLPDITWGQRVAAIVVLNGGAVTLQLKELQKWSTDHLANYCIPTVLKVVDTIPRNELGKVNKKELTEKLFPREMKQTI